MRKEIRDARDNFIKYMNQYIVLLVEDDDSLEEIESDLLGTVSREMEKYWDESHAG